MIFDTGVSFGLSPFRSDFIDYVECNIEVKDISKINIVIGIGTTLHHFTTASGESIWLPCLSYHLPSSEVRLFRPQTYHTIYGGQSLLHSDHVDMLLDVHTVVIPIDRATSNVPMVYNSYVNLSDMCCIGPQVKSALPAVDRRVDLFSGLGATFFDEMNIARDDI